MAAPVYWRNGELAGSKPKPAQPHNDFFCDSFVQDSPSLFSPFALMALRGDKRALARLHAGATEIEVTDRNPLFVFGTLRDEDILFAVLGRRLDPAQRQPAVAHGFRAVPFPGKVYPVLRADGQGFAEGMLLRGLTPIDISLLDAFEGSVYRRLAISVEAAGRAEAAEVYWADLDLPEDAPAWSFEDWRRTGKAEMLVRAGEGAARTRARLAAQPPIWPQAGEI